MNGIVKIVLALKLKFLLIALSLGGSYFMEYKMKKQENAASHTELIKPHSNLTGTGNMNARNLFLMGDDHKDPRIETRGYYRIHPVKYSSTRAFRCQGLEIYIEL